MIQNWVRGLFIFIHDTFSLHTPPKEKVDYQLEDKEVLNIVAWNASRKDLFSFSDLQIPMDKNRVMQVYPHSFYFFSTSPPAETFVAVLTISIGEHSKGRSTAR